MKNLESINGQLGADLAQGEVGILEKSKEETIGEEKVEAENVSKEINGEKENELSAACDKPNHELKDTENNGYCTTDDEEEEIVNDNDEDKVSSVSLSTDFEISPIEVSPPEVSLAKEGAEESQEASTEDSRVPADIDIQKEAVPSNVLESSNGGESLEDDTKDVPGDLEEKEDQPAESSVREHAEDDDDSVAKVPSSPSHVSEVTEDRIDSASQVRTDPDASEDEENQSDLANKPQEEEEGQKSEENDEKVYEDISKEDEISLSAAEDPDDAYVSDDGSVDINEGLQECFKNLEEKIALEAKQEEEERVKEAMADLVKIDPKARDVPADEEKSEEQKMEEEILTLDPDIEEEPMATEDDHESALQALEKIENSNRKIMDEEAGDPVKRSLPVEDETEPASKKARVTESPQEKEKEETVDKRKLHKALKRLTRSELEEMIGNKMVEVMTNKSEIGKLRQKVDSYEETIAKWKQRAQALSKQCTDLGTVMKKYITDNKNKPGERVAPVRITRSVGLQVVNHERRLQQQKQEQQVKLQLAAAGARIATRPASVSNGAVRKPAPVARPANGVMRHSSGLVAVPVSTTARTAVNTTVAAVRKTGGLSLTPQSRLMKSPVRQTAPSPAPASKKKVIDVVNLSDEEEAAQPPLVRITPVRAVPSPVRAPPRPSLGPRPRLGVTGPQPRHRTVLRAVAPLLSHPAPLPQLPRQPMGQGFKQLPPKPTLKIQRAPNEKNGIILSWTLSHNPSVHATITGYQLYAYQETAARPDTSLWKRVGNEDVKAMPLPMACTLTQFSRGCKYYFAVRAVDCHRRLGMFSEPHSILLSNTD